MVSCRILTLQGSGRVIVNLEPSLQNRHDLLGSVQMAEVLLKESIGVYLSDFTQRWKPWEEA